MKTKGTLKIAVTGGSGFIGQRLIETLQDDGHQIVSIDLNHETPIDVLNLQDLTNAMRGCDVVYHLAAAHRDDIMPRSVYYDVNGGGMKNLIEAANQCQINHIIFTSSVAIYGLNAANATEDTQADPFNDYGKSKLEAEQYLRQWAEEESDRKAVCIRPVVVFGEGNRGNVHALIRQIQSGKFLKIGAGHNKKSMAYVGNVAEFLKYCLSMQDKNFTIFNYADKPDMSVNSLLQTIYTALKINQPNIKIPYIVGLLAGYGFDGLARISGRTFPVSSVRIQKFCADTTVDATACHTCGFKPSFTLEDGLSRMIHHDFLQTDMPDTKGHTQNLDQAA